MQWACGYKGRSIFVILAVAGCQQSSAQQSEAPPPKPTAETTTAASSPGASSPSGAPAASASAQNEPVKEAPKEEKVPDGMVKLPAGIFLMGANIALGNPEERPAHEAIVASFYIDKTEVTVNAYARCVTAGACKPAHIDQQFCNAKYPDRGDHPITCVDLPMAEAYCEWAGGRLPTEREWEYAASNGVERRRFSWGNVDPTTDNCCYYHPFGSCKVASFEPGAFGLYDMTGNAWEWTISAFKPYPSHDRPDAIEDKTQYVHRGGSWSRRFPKWMRNILRNRWTAAEYSASLGMRCIKPITPIECPPETSEKDGICVRTSGEVLCEPNFKFDGTKCKPDASIAMVAEQSLKRGTSNVQTNPGGIGGPEPGSDPTAVTEAVTRSRTPQWDSDCARHWPAFPFSYLFKGGENYPARKPIVRAAGCTPRDMSGGWTSACCKG